MFERLKRLIKNGISSLTPPDDEPDSVDHPRPRRANPNPPKRDWFARVSEKSTTEAQLTPENEQQLGELLTRTTKSTTPRAR